MYKKLCLTFGFAAIAAISLTVSAQPNSDEISNVALTVLDLTNFSQVLNSKNNVLMNGKVDSSNETNKVLCYFSTGTGESLSVQKDEVIKPGQATYEAVLDFQWVTVEFRSKDLFMTCSKPRPIDLGEEGNKITLKEIQEATAGTVQLEVIIDK